MDSIRDPGEQRRLLAATIRNTADWRAETAREFQDDDTARRENVYSKNALRTLANFVEALADDDPDLNLHALRRADERHGRLVLAEDSATLLSRFGLNIGAWKTSNPTEAQMRNLLRRIDGIEAAERHASRQRAEMVDCSPAVLTAQAAAFCSGSWASFQVCRTSDGVR